MLEEEDSVSLHKRNLRFLAWEMFKLKKGMNPELIKKLFLPNRQHTCESLNSPDFVVTTVKSVHKGLESLSRLGPRIWELLPLEIKETETLLQFKAKIKKWIPKTVLVVFAECTCRMLDSFRLINSVNVWVFYHRFLCQRRVDEQ